MSPPAGEPALVPLEGDAARLTGADLFEVDRLYPDAGDAVTVRPHLARVAREHLVAVGEEHRDADSPRVLDRADELEVEGSEPGEGGVDHGDVRAGGDGGNGGGRRGRDRHRRRVLRVG